MRTLRLLALVLGLLAITTVASPWMGLLPSVTGLFGLGLLLVAAGLLAAALRRRPGLPEDARAPTLAA